MAKKSKDLTPEYYVYYDKSTGEILSVSNEKTLDYTYRLDVTFDDIKHLMSGDWKFIDYLVGYKKLADETVLSIIPKVDDDYAFRGGVFEWLSEGNTESEITVEWNNVAQQWTFYLSTEAKQSYEDGILTPRLTFFVTLESDLDFLIREIVVDVQELLTHQTMIVPFSCKLEHDISKISIGTRLIFKSYKLRVINE